jgi:membrane associated rhomboid family serine protease
MFYPIGDDIAKRTLPIVGIVLILINVSAFAYTERLWIDSFPSKKPARTNRSQPLQPPKKITPQMIAASPWGQFMDRWGLVPAKLAKGDIRVLFSSMFLHVNLAHLLGNMLVLWALVGSLESALKPLVFLCLYIVWGLAAGLAHAASDWQSLTPMVGASGAIAAMMGAYCVLFGALAKIHFVTILFFRPMRFSVPAGFVFFLWFVTQLSGIESQSSNGLKHGGVAYFAHLGGFVVGIITVLPFKARLMRKLKLTHTGQLEFTEEPKDKGVALAPLVKDGIPAAVPQVKSCPYCQTPLEDSHRIAPNLARCPNPACGRLAPLPN